MRLTFEYITVKAFKHVANANFVYARRSPGLHFVRGINKVSPRTGSNQSGKSSILVDAPCWCLYGRTPEGLRNPDVKPWTGKETPHVTLGIRIDDEKHVIERKASTNGLTLDGNATDQNHIDALVGMPFDLAIHTFLLPQGQDLFLDLGPSEQLEKFSTTLNLNRWDYRADRASRKASALEAEVNRINGELAAKETVRARLTEDIEKFRELRDNWSEQRATEAEEIAREIKDLEKRLKVKEANYDKANLAYDGAGTELKAARTDVDKIHVKQAKLRLDRRPVSMRRVAISTEIDLLTEQISGLGDGQTCPVCGQKAKGTQLDHHVQEARAKIAALESEAEELEAKESKLAKQENQLNEELRNLMRSVSEYSAKEEAAKTNLDSYTPEIAEIRARLTELRRRAEAAASEENPYMVQWQRARRDLERVKTEEKDLRKRKADQEAYHSRTKFWVKGFRDVRLFVMEEVLEELTLATDVMLPEVGLDGWSVEYVIERDTKAGGKHRGLTAIVKSPFNKGPVKWESFSGGARQRLRLVSALALSDVLLARAGVEPSMEVLDEPTTFLSSEGITDLCDFLADRAQRLSRQIYYAEHASVESDRFASVITITRSPNGVTITSR